MATKTKNEISGAIQSTQDYRAIVGRTRRKKTEARILEAALQVFAEKGPDAPVIDDFIKAAGIARGTFYNYYSNTSQLLEATSNWLTDDLIESIEGELRTIKDPALRHGVGMRLWMQKAALDPAWSSFVATIWFQGGYARDAPLRDIQMGIDAGKFFCPTALCGWDITLGAIRQAMIRLLKEPKLRKGKYCDQIVVTILQGLGASKQTCQEAIAYQLPEMRRPTRTLFGNTMLYIR